MTNKQDIFEQARSCVTESLIRYYFDCEKSENYGGKNGPELKTLCPFRNDKKVGSFYINLHTGFWQDYSPSATEKEGDFIKLVELTFNLKPKEAAERIIYDSGQDLPESPKPETKEKPKHIPVIPIPREALRKLNDHVKGSFIIKKFGRAVTGWKMRQPDGQPWMCVTRHFKDGVKNDIPYQFCTDGKWHAGCPVSKKRHLYNIEKLPSEFPKLIVEGLKCADVEIENYLSISWWGGGNQVNKYNWTPLKNIENVIIWPDYDIKKNKFDAIFPDRDQPGLKTALEIQKKIKNAKILDVYKWCRDNNKKDGWDIYDAKEEGIDLSKFIEERGFYRSINLHQNPEDNNSHSNSDDNTFPDSTTQALVPPPFKFMGHDDSRHFFLVSRSNIIKSITFGAFSNGKLLELAPLSYWSFNFIKKDSFDLNCASDWIINESEKKGFHKKENIRGSGVWMDDKRIIINSGQKIFNQDGENLENFDTKYFYTNSQKQMGNFSGPIATDKQGYDLVNLFIAQGFETELEAFIALGWALIAPFAGVLKWRPHIWITGPKNCGKTYFLENFIQALIDPFCHVGSGKDSAPGIYRSVKSDPVPILLDEMEPGKNSNRDTIRKIEEKLELARNASSDFSGHITLANTNHGGSDSFFIRSPFCFSSIVPYMQGEAIESRILTCRMKNMNLVKSKIEATKKILKTGIMDDPGIFRRKIFKNLHFTLKYINNLKKLIIKETGEIRKADNLAPLFAATYSIVNQGKIPDEKKSKEFVIKMISQFEVASHESDEDKLMRAIFDFVIRVTVRESLSVAELLVYISKSLYGMLTKDEEKEIGLKRYGIKIHETDGCMYLAIATAHTQLQEILNETMYSGQYVRVLKRHSAYVKNMSVRFAGQNKDAVLLKWDEIEKRYFGENKESEDLLPF